MSIIADKIEQSVEHVIDDKSIIRSVIKQLIEKTIKITIEIPASTSKLTLVNNNRKQFDFPFELKKIHIRTETDAKASVRIAFNESQYIPSEAYLIDATNNFNATNAEGLYATNDRLTTYSAKKSLKKGWNLKVYGKNTHTSNQKVYIFLNGFEINTKPIKNQII